MTAPRRPRSPWLLVGSTPSVWVKVQRAGQRLRRFLANWRWYFVLELFRAARSALAAGPVGVGLVAGPGGEELARDAQALVAELLLFGHAFAVGGEVPEQMRPAELPAGRVEVVVAA